MLVFLTGAISKKPPYHNNMLHVKAPTTRLHTKEIFFILIIWAFFILIKLKCFSEHTFKGRETERFKALNQSSYFVPKTSTLTTNEGVPLPSPLRCDKCFPQTSPYHYSGQRVWLVPTGTKKKIKQFWKISVTPKSYNQVIQQGWKTPVAPKEV